LTQNLNQSSITGAEVCAMLSVSPAWLARHRGLFEWFRIPGRGANGQEYRFSKKSIESYMSRGISEALAGSDPFAGKSAKEITSLIKSGIGVYSQETKH
jgi:hypothetical protein